MKKIIKEINNNQNLEMNLPVYARHINDLYNKCAAVEMAMDYYTFYEMVSDGEIKDSKLKEYTEEFNSIIKEYVVDVKVDENREKAVERIDILRNKIYKTVDILAAYADIFSRYEYVSNRCEYLFKEETVDSKYTDEDFTREIMQYIFSDEDNTVINSKICEIIAELPLRLTKSKFFQLLSDGLSVYSKTDKETIDDFVYVLKSSSMLALPDGLEDYSELNEIYEMVKAVDYSKITKEEFDKLENELRYAADFIDKETNVFMMLQGIVNRTYVMILSAPYVDEYDKEVECSMKIIKEINNNFTSGEYITLPDEVTDLFVFLEGVPEKVHSKIEGEEFALDNIKNNHLSIIKSIMADNIYQGLFISQNLISDSLFADLSDIKNIFEEKSEEETEFDIKEYINTVRDELVMQLTEFFKNNQKQVNRSVMALIISRLPVFFNNITEVQDYVYNSLSNCTNKAEKSAAIEIIKCIINEN